MINRKFKIDYNQLLDYFKRKDYNSYNDKELELLTEIFKYTCLQYQIIQHYYWPLNNDWLKRRIAKSTFWAHLS